MSKRVLKLFYLFILILAFSIYKEFFVTLTVFVEILDLDFRKYFFLLSLYLKLFMFLDTKYLYT